MKWSVGRKIGSLLVLTVVIFALFGGASYCSLKALIDSTEITEHTYKVIPIASEILIDVLYAETSKRGYSITGDERYLSQFNAAVTAVQNEIREARKQIRSETALQNLTKVESAFNEKLAIMSAAPDPKQIVAGEDAAKREALTQSLLQKGKAATEEIQKGIDEIKAIETGLVVERSATMKADSRTTMNIIVYGIPLALLVLLLIGYVIAQNIVVPLAGLTETAEKIAAGDLDANFPIIERTDEVGTLSKSFRTMVDSLRESRDVSEAAHLLVSSSNEILSATTQVASSTAETVTAIGETTTTVEEIRQSVQLSTQTAKDVAESALRVGKVAQDGSRSVDETSAEMTHIRDQMESIAGTIVRLSDQTQSIGGIIASVTDIADQSNLLAVNAAIEAAKAGEQGRGFAVVAQEIKSLAEQSKQSTMQVRAILNDIQKATSAAVMATEQGTKAVETGVKQSARAGEAIKQLAENVETAARAVSQIVISSQQQSIGMDQICLAMANIQKAGTQNVESMRQTEAVAKNMSQLGERLMKLVNQSLPGND